MLIKKLYDARVDLNSCFVQNISKMPVSMGDKKEEEKKDEKKDDKKAEDKEVEMVNEPWKSEFQ